MTPDRNTAIAAEIMQEFAENTGLTGSGRPRRYLWTDAFAVCNFLELHHRSGERRYRDLALQLVDQVHRVLGRHREDDSRSGWLSGLAEQEGAAHPTRGGLRIGKNLPERQPAEPLDERLEWERDGQYFHYLTKWMHALHQVASATGEEKYGRWALELAEAAHNRFITRPSSHGPKRLYWKMSIDLSRPLIPAMGQHDPLDGYITYLELQVMRPAALQKQIHDMAEMCREQDWTTDDPLGIGGILFDSLRIARLMLGGKINLRELFGSLLESSATGLADYARQNPLMHPAEYRLAFRELGLAIGLHALQRLKERIAGKPDYFEPTAPLHHLLDYLATHQELGHMIEDFWQNAQNRQTESWTSHRDINMVMLATSLIPDGFLGEQPDSRSRNG